jgi:hypothetical protein
MSAAAVVAELTVQQRIDALTKRFSAIEARIRQAEKQQADAKKAAAHHDPTALTTAPVLSKKQLAALPNLKPDPKDTPEVAALRAECINIGMSSAIFQWVSSEYYDKPLQWRRDTLKAPSIHYLCKSILLENTHCTNNDCSDRNNSRYYCCLFQYTTKFDSDAVARFIKELNPGLGKKKFGFRLADPVASAELTGVGKNAVAPFGMKQPIPIILSDELLKLQPGYFWMGGGHVDVKLRADTAEFVRILNPFVTHFTTPLTDEELAALKE